VGNVFEVLYDVLFQPKVAMQIIADKKNISQAVVVFLLSLFIPLWALYFGLQEAGISTMIHFFMGFKIVSGILMWFMGAAVWHLIAEFFGGRGTGKGLFVTLGFAHFPQVFIVPLWAFAALLPVSLKTIVMAVAALAILCWSLFLTVTAMKEVYQFSTAKAVLVIVTPLLVAIVVCAIVFAFIGSALTQMPMLL
jgi:hypothetical protein